MPNRENRNGGIPTPQRCKSTLPGLIAALFTAALLLLISFGPACAGDIGIALYRIGDEGRDATAFVKRFLEMKGYQVDLYQGETTIEKHVEKANLINRGKARAFVAMEMTTGERGRVIVAITEAKKADGRFLTLNEVPERFSEESQSLADSVAGCFGVRVKRMPLFPLLGIAMPAIFIKAQGTEKDLPDVANKLYLGIEKYFRKG